jgi:hypothetical protein
MAAAAASSDAFVYTRAVRDHIMDPENHTVDFHYDSQMSHPIHIQLGATYIAGELYRQRKLEQREALWLTMEDLKRVLLVKK